MQCNGPPIARIQKKTTNKIDISCSRFYLVKPFNFFLSKILRADYAQTSKERFLEANDLEIEDTGSREAAAEMRRLVKQIKNIYIPSVKEIADSKGVILN